ncbi:neutral zinc metallopeptidase [Flaviaesturariibacter amylovorans]|uniref:Neutral zinc metallopeptidase n=1 Tax=Flaviaesturariibacter amylovorans TaxID=1084520 RepID=A0ABP8GHS6_9BACT
MDDRRGGGMSGGGIAAGGGILGVIALVLNFLLGGGNGGDGQMAPLPGQTTQQVSTEQRAAEDQLASFVKVVLADTEDVWGQLFQRAGQRYPAPTLVLFTDRVQSGCGYASAQSGPFYCPADQKVYVDLSFYNELRNRFGGGGDFAMAYVIAHEVGHHIQTLMGTSEKMARMRGRVSEAEYNQFSVRMELQADFFAGVFAHYQKGKGYLEEGDIEEALRAANAIGDDNIQKQSQGYTVPESFTHGTSEQRMRWFKKGFETGDINQGDTFNTNDL